MLLLDEGRSTPESEPPVPMTEREEAKKLAKLNKIITKYRYRSRDLIPSILQVQETKADNNSNSMVKSIALPSKIIQHPQTTHPAFPKHLQPDHVHVNVSLSTKHSHSHPNIDSEQCTNNQTIVEAKSTGQWWSLNNAFGASQIDHIVDRATKGLHSLVLSQASSDLTSPCGNNLLAFESHKEGQIIKTYRELKRSILQHQKQQQHPPNAEPAETYLTIRVICHHVNPSTCDTMLAMTHLPSLTNTSAARGTNDETTQGRQDTQDTQDTQGITWDTYNQPTLENEFNLLSFWPQRTDELMLIQILAEIQAKHVALLKSNTMETSMLQTFKSPGRLSCGNGRTTFIKTCRNHTNWIVQLLVPSQEESIEIQQRRYESTVQRNIFASKSKAEAVLHEKCEVKLPSKIKQLHKKFKKLEDTRLSAIKQRQMKVAFACVDKKKKCSEKIEKLNEELKALKLNLYGGTAAKKSERRDGGRGGLTLEVYENLQLNTELSNNLNQAEKYMPLHGVSCVTFIALLCASTHPDCVAVRESLLVKGMRNTTGGKHRKTTGNSTIVRKLMQLYTPDRTSRGTRQRKVGKRNTTIQVYDHAPPPGIRSTRGLNKMAHTAQFVGLWCHAILEIDHTTCDPSGIIDVWHELYVAFVQGHAVLKIQLLLRRSLAKQELERRQYMKQMLDEKIGAIAIQCKMRYCLAKKAVKRRKKDIKKAEIFRLRQIEKEKVAAKAAIEKEKKLKAMRVIKAKKNAKLAIEEEEKKRRGY